MGSYLKGIELPTTCASCDIACRHYLAFGADGLLSKICRTESRRPDCPLVPVPPHGRLGDLDRMLADNEIYYNQLGRADGEIGARYQSVKRSIELAPTIIPAEEE